jgi:hypothetical protein
MHCAFQTLYSILIIPIPEKIGIKVPDTSLSECSSVPHIQPVAEREQNIRGSQFHKKHSTHIKDEWVIETSGSVMMMYLSWSRKYNW